MTLGDLAAADCDAVGVGSVEQTELTYLILLPQLDSIASLVLLQFPVIPPSVWVHSLDCDSVCITPYLLSDRFVE